MGKSNLDGQCSDPLDVVQIAQEKPITDLFKCFVVVTFHIGILCQM